MGVSLYRTVKMGDMQALYFLEETERHMSLMLLPGRDGGPGSRGRIRNRAGGLRLVRRPT